MHNGKCQSLNIRERLFLTWILWRWSERVVGYHIYFSLQHASPYAKAICSTSERFTFSPVVQGLHLASPLTVTLKRSVLFCLQVLSKWSHLQHENTIMSQLPVGNPKYQSRWCERTHCTGEIRYIIFISRQSFRRL